MNQVRGKTATDPQVMGLERVVEALRQRGVEAGERAAQELRREAEAQALEIVAQARVQAREQLDAAQRDADQQRARLDGELRQATRAGILEFRQALERAVLVPAVDAGVGAVLDDPQQLPGLVREALGALAAADGSDPEVVLPAAMKQRLGDAILGPAIEALRRGVKVRWSDELSTGFIVEADGARMDVTDDALREVLMRLVSPRFRARLAEGGAQ